MPSRYDPPLHLTFQGTRISSLRCQTFSTCSFAPVPYVNSSGVPGGWAGRSGSSKVDAKMGLEGETRAIGLPSTFGFAASFSASDDTVSESKKDGCVGVSSVMCSPGPNKTNHPDFSEDI